MVIKMVIANTMLEISLLVLVDSPDDRNKASQLMATMKVKRAYRIQIVQE